MKTLLSSHSCLRIKGWATAAGPVPVKCKDHFPKGSEKAARRARKISCINMASPRWRLGQRPDQPNYSKMLQQVFFKHTLSHLKSRSIFSRVKTAIFLIVQWKSNTYSWAPHTSAAYAMSSCTGFTGPFPALKQKRSAAIGRLPIPTSPGCDLSVPEKTKCHVTKTSLIKRLFPQYMFSNFILKETDHSTNNITNMLFFFSLRDSGTIKKSGQ